MHIIRLQPENAEAVDQAATILYEEFKIRSPNSWPDMGSAVREVRKAFDENRFALVAVNERDQVMGWIGGIRLYRGNTYELHPLVVKSEHQKKGIGTALVAAFEAEVKSRGCVTIFLGTDDENSETTLAGIDLYPDPVRHIANIRNLKGHPFEFYRKMGYVIVGVLPDANGPGKPDIFMAKRVG